MSACPSCGAEMGRSAACPKCGAKASSPLDVPDLDLSAVGKPAPPLLRRNSGQMAAPTIGQMEADDVLAEDYGEAQFELDLSDPPPSLKPPVSLPPVSAPSLQPPPPSNAPVPGPRELTASDVPASPGQNAEGGAMNVSAPPLSSSAKVDPHEAADLAAYGPVPTSLVKLPLYAVRVRMRQPELARGLERAEHALAQAQREHGAALSDPSRLEEVKARLHADLAVKERDVERHRAALVAFDHVALKKGTELGVGLVLAAFLLLFSPVLFRACVGVDAPLLNQTTSPTPGQTPGHTTGQPPTATTTK